MKILAKCKLLHNIYNVNIINSIKYIYAIFTKINALNFNINLRKFQKYFYISALIIW